MMQSETIAALAEALAKFQAQAEGARKNAQNPHLKNKYADLGSVWEAVREPLTIYGLSVVQLPMPSEAGTLRLRTQLLHKSGEWLASELVMPLAKQDPQGYGSALTYARRYALAALLGVVQEDDDAERATRRPPVGPAMATPEQVKRIQAGAQHLGWDDAGLAEYLATYHGAAGLDALTADKAAVILDGMRELARQQKEAA